MPAGEPLDQKVSNAGIFAESHLEGKQWVNVGSRNRISDGKRRNSAGWHGQLACAAGQPAQRNDRIAQIPHRTDLGLYLAHA